MQLLSGDSPDLNPDEQVWNQLKEKLGKAAFKTKDDFVSFVTSKMRSLQNMPEVVKVFFRPHDTCYACRSDYDSGTIWHTRGMTPVVEAAGSRFGQNLIAAISSEGNLRYMTMQRFNADVFIKFLRQIVRSHNRPVIIATDSHRAHHSKKV